MVSALSQSLPGLGAISALDGKTIASHARGRKRNRKGGRRRDGRRDTDLDWGRNDYRGGHTDGTPWQETASWFGCCLHLIVDAGYELPVDFSVSKASDSEVRVAHRLVDRMAVERPELLVRCEHFLGDKAYDDGKLLAKLWGSHGNKPVMGIRDVWKGEGMRMLRKHPDVVYGYKTERRPPGVHHSGPNQPSLGSSLR